MDATILPNNNAVIRRNPPLITLTPSTHRNCLIRPIHTNIPILKYISYIGSMKKCKKTEQLGISPSTAYNRLKKNLMFSMAQLLDMDWCFQCGAKIESKEELSVEHMVPWQNSENPVELFYDITNIAFSHRGCNSGASRGRNRISKPCPSTTAYRRGCRCEGCRKAQSDYRKSLKRRYQTQEQSQ
tara:strand:- start:351 stop:905 length:555 start_codon:yes stop_codon:yes gene_type:complete